MLTTRQPFLFMEPDAVPLCEGWIDAIEAEYRACGSPFMGDLVDLSKSDVSGIDHMSGIAVYDWNLSITAPRLFNCNNGKEEFAWDIFAASDILPKMHRTNLIQHDWDRYRRGDVDPSAVREGAVIYHPDKQGVLFNDGLAGPLNSVQGEPATGAPVSVSSFKHEGSASISNEEKPQIQFEEAPTDQQAIVLERFNSVLVSARSDSKLKRQVKQSLIQHGWIKAPKKGKRTRKKVSPPVGDA
jgi:hypothetical protein